MDIANIGLLKIKTDFPRATGPVNPLRNEQFEFLLWNPRFFFHARPIYRSMLCRVHAFIFQSDAKKNINYQRIMISGISARTSISQRDLLSSSDAEQLSSDEYCSNAIEFLAVHTVRKFKLTNLLNSWLSRVTYRRRSCVHTSCNNDNKFPPFLPINPLGDNLGNRISVPEKGRIPRIPRTPSLFSVT